MTAPGPTILLGGRSRCAFHVWGVAGYTAAAALTITLTVSAGLFVPVVLLLQLLAAAVFYALAMATRMVLRTECLIYYHHEIAVLAVSGAVLRLLGFPLLAYLDVAAIGLGVFLAFGRLGCASVGCCYGKPAARGFVYGLAHAEAGFPAALCGVRLLPVQWIESALVAALTTISASLVWRHAQPGTALTVYVAGYALLRFSLEFFRGDDGRGYVAGFSVAQWTSAAFGVGLAAPAPVLAPVLPLAMLAIAAYRRREGPWLAWFEARHVHELANLLAIAHRDRQPLVFRTSEGLRLSAGVGTIGGAAVEHYTLSSAAGPIPPGPARRLARLLAQLRGRPRCHGSLVPGGQGVVHVILSTTS